MERPSGIQDMHVAGRTFEVETKDLALTDIKLDPQNPRIRYMAETKGIAPKTNEAIRDLLLEDDDIRRLYSDIKREDGLHDPILVNKDGTIIEGNSRAACYLKLYGNGNGGRKRIPARVLRTQMSEKDVAALQAHYHIKGKNKWDAYAKAEHFFRMSEDHKMTPEDIHKTTGMHKKSIEDMIESYRMMRANAFGKGKKNSPDMAVRTYSYFNEFQKSGNEVVKEFRAKKANREWFAKMVDEGRFEKGSDVRKLPAILKSKQAMRAFEQGGIKAANPIIGQVDPTSDSARYRKIKKLTEELNEDFSPEAEHIKNNPKCGKLLEDLGKMITNLLAAAERLSNAKR